MKFFKMNMADALLFGIAAIMALCAVAIVVTVLTSTWGTAAIAAMIALAVILAALAFKLAARTLANPLPVFEPAPSTDYRPKTKARTA